jgi:DNA polymerase
MQNLNQGFARDVFAEAVLRVEAAGIPVILHIHDEVLCHVPAGFDKNKLTELMTVRPSWAKKLPIASDTKLMPRYKK